MENTKKDKRDKLTLEDCIWITWEEQRRTDVLSAELGVPLYRLTSSSNYLWRLLKLGFQTLSILFKICPGKLIIQNPSMALAALTVFFKPFFGYKLIIDRHSNFKFHTVKDPSLKFRFFHLLSRYTVRKADLTVVTNTFLAQVVQDWGGQPFILQDKLPTLHLAGKTKLEGQRNLALVFSFSADEPVKEVLLAARALPPDVVFYITGNWKRLDRSLLENLPPQVRLTGYLSEKDFQTLINSVDAVMAFTSQDHTLLCSAYEAISLGKPFLTSDTSALKAYFRKGVLFTKHDAHSMVKSMTMILEESQKRSDMIRELATILAEEWTPQFRDLAYRIKALQ